MSDTVNQVEQLAAEAEQSASAADAASTAAEAALQAAASAEAIAQDAAAEQVADEITKFETRISWLEAELAQQSLHAQELQQQQIESNVALAGLIQWQAMVAETVEALLIQQTSPETQDQSTAEAEAPAVENQSPESLPEPDAPIPDAATMTEEKRRRFRRL